MKPFLVFISYVFLFFSVSCRFEAPQNLEPMPPGLVYERVFYNNNMENFNKMVVSADGNQLLLTDDYKYIELWTRPFLSPMKILPLEDRYASLTELDFFGENQKVFFTNSVGVVQIWDHTLNEQEFRYQFDGPSNNAAISSCGRFIANEDELYDRQKKGLVGSPVAHAFQTGLCFGGRSLLLTSGFHDQSIAVRNIISGKFEYRQIAHPIEIAAISLDEKYIAAVARKGRKGRLYFWRWPEQDPEVVKLESTGFLAFSPDSKWFVTAGGHWVHIYRTNPFSEIARFRPNPTITEDFAITCADIASDNLLVIGDWNGYAHIWDVSGGRMIGRHKVCERPVWPIKLIPDKGFLWVGSGRFYSDDLPEKSEIALYRIEGLEPYIRSDLNR